MGIGEVARQTGVHAATLRAWEKRFGFPTPARLPSGQRRYGELDVAAVRQVMTNRHAGMTLEAAIGQAREVSRDHIPSFFEGVLLRGQVRSHVVSKRAMLAMSRALEDECYLRAAGGILVGAFQRAEFYRASSARWARLARLARHTVVMADFHQSRFRPHEPAEVAIQSRSPLEAEWAVISLGHRHAAMLVGRELPDPKTHDHGRMFEAGWSVQPPLVRQALRIAIPVCHHESPDLAAALAAALDALQPDQMDIEFLTGLTNRMVGYLDRPSPR